MRGSSPLARGLRPGPRYAPGKREDHPRSRGVYSLYQAAQRGDSGSSPLARGLRGRGPGDRVRPGIIPARAGFTPAPCAGAPPPPDHPRSRGVYGGHRLPAHPRQGSSPLARGLLSRWPSAPRRSLDHPRSRGVYGLVAVRRCDDEGSSPLARGLPRAPGGGQARGRIIPARAGFTSDDEPRKPDLTDHPRSRGVYSARRIGLNLAPRIIPARAGFTVIGGYPSFLAGDHPRSRGVYTLTAP